MHTGRASCENLDRDWDDSSMRQQTSKFDNKPPKPEERHGTDSPSWP